MPKMKPSELKCMKQNQTKIYKESLEVRVGSLRISRGLINT